MRVPTCCALGLVGRILTLTLVFTVVLGLASIAFAAIVAAFYGDPPKWQPHLLAGLVCSLIVLLFVATFHFRRESIKLPFRNRSRFLIELNETLKEMGYEPTGSADSTSRMYFPHIRSFLFGGSVNVAEVADGIKLTGPKVSLELVRSRLRFKNHLLAVHQSIEQAPFRWSECIIKRVHLTVRAEPNQLDEIREHVVDVLAEKGDVVCELNILVNADEGFPERLVDAKISDWLQERGIAVEIHKDHIQRLDSADTRPIGA